MNGQLLALSSSLGSTQLISGVQYDALGLPRQYALGNNPSATVALTYWGSGRYLAASLQRLIWATPID